MRLLLVTAPAVTDTAFSMPLNTTYSGRATPEDWLLLLPMLEVVVVVVVGNDVEVALTRIDISEHIRKDF